MADDLSIQDNQRLFYSMLSLTLILFSGLCSGATQGLLSIDEITLEIKLKYGTNSEKKWARRILPLIKQHHLLLSTLLVANSISNETLPILLKRIAPDWMAILVSVVLVVFIGEIIPSALMTGPSQIKIAYYITPFIQCLESILFLICYPLSLFLDYVLGTKAKRYHLQYIRQLMELHSKNDVLAPEELRIIASIMEMRTESIMSKITPTNQICYVMSDEPLCKRLITKIAIKAYSQIPIIEDNVIVGTFNSKELIKYDQTYYGKLIINLVKVKKPLIISEETTMLELLPLFFKYKTSIAFIYSTDLIGLIGLNDLYNVIADEQFADQDIHGTVRYDYQQSQLY